MFDAVRCVALAQKPGSDVGVRGELLKQFVAVAIGLVDVARTSDADLVEVNPLAVVPSNETPGGERIVCLDAKITIDDSALERRPDLAAWRDEDSEDPADRTAREAGIAYIRLDGSIGCMVNGAGLAMTTLDLVTRAGGTPANFLDIGGGARADKVAAAMRIILADVGVKAILVNIFGGITRGDEVARGLIEARAQQERTVPMVVRIVGTNAEAAARILAEAGDPDQEAAVARYGMTVPFSGPLHEQRARFEELVSLGYTDVWSAEANIGVPVRPFPRWMRCVKCGLRFSRLMLRFPSYATSLPGCAKRQSVRR